LSKRFISINGNVFFTMVMSAAEELGKNVERVNGLNVFPVPDGDTGTNMNLTLTSGVDELRRRPSSHIGKAADALSKGLLMGARGNSGVILSQLFRGFAKAVHDHEEIGVTEFAAALQQGVDTAYKAVVKPVEGTVLTVSKEAAKAAGAYARRATGIDDLMREVLSQAKETLRKTPEMLPVLKQVGVVDAGGQGLVHVYEGFLAVLTAQTGDIVAAPDGAIPEALGSFPVASFANAQTADLLHGHEPRRVQAMMSTEDIEFGYCTEFLINIVPGKTAGVTFDEIDFREELGKHGDSLLVVADDDLVKVHIHAEYPGEVMTIAQRYGDLSRIKIENMRDQHSHILMEELRDAEAAYRAAGAAETADEDVVTESIAHEPEAQRKPFGFISVAAGDGITDIFMSVGIDVVLSGGQTMNPSTQDFVSAIETIDADTIFILPNNSNIIMAARQAAELTEDKQIIVIPTKTIPQGMAAVLAFQEQSNGAKNEETMNYAIQSVRSGQVTYAVRDTSIDSLDIKLGDYIGIQDGKIVISESTIVAAVKSLLTSMIDEGSEIVTILTGEDAKDEETGEVLAYLKEMHPEVEVELHDGGQPIYAYLFSVE